MNTYNELMNEKEISKAYIGTLQSLDFPFSNRIDLLPGELAVKAENYYNYENKLADPSLEEKNTAREIQELRDRCRKAFNDFHNELTSWLGYHGYTFGRPDSLKNNLHQRLKDLMEDYHAAEGAETEPLLVDYTYRTPASQIVPNVAEYNQATMQLHGTALLLDEEEPAYMMEGGMKALHNLINTQQTSSPMQITQIGNVYGAVYAIKVTEELTRRVMVDADSRESAAEAVRKMIDRNEVVLDSNDYVGVSIGNTVMDLAAGKFQYEPYAEAGPDGKYTVRITEYLETIVNQEGFSREDAEERVREAYEDEDIVLGAEDYDCREIVPAYHISVNGLSEPEPITVIDRQNIQRLMQAAHPDSMYIRFYDESVSHLLQLAAGGEHELYGIIGTPARDVEWRLDEGTTLRTEAYLRPSDYASVCPCLDYYFSAAESEGMDPDTYTCTHYLYRHPNLDKGYMTVAATNNILDRIRVEGIPFRDAIRIMADQLIADDQQFKEAAAIYRRQHGLEMTQSMSQERRRAYPDLERITDIVIIRGMDNCAYIRCRIDGEQQGSQLLNSRDRILLSNERITKEELALKYFKEELSYECEQKNGRHR